MFEVPTPESHTHPADTSKRDMSAEAYQEMWIHDIAIELRGNVEKLAEAIAWHAQNYPNESDGLYIAQATWMASQQVSGSAFIAKQVKACRLLEGKIEAIAEAYATEVLWPAHLKAQ